IGREIAVVGAEDLLRPRVVVDLGEEAAVAHRDDQRILGLGRIRRGPHRVRGWRAAQVGERDEAVIRAMSTLHRARPSKSRVIRANDWSRSDTVAGGSGQAMPIAGSSNRTPPSASGA